MSETSVDLQKKYFKLSSVIDHFLNTDVELPVSHYFQKFLTAAKWYLVQLKTVHAQDVKTVLLELSDVLTAPLPPDLVQLTKVGEKWGQYVRTLGVSHELSLTDRTLGNPDFIYTGPPGQLPNGTNVTDYGGYYFSNYGGGALFSLGGGLPQNGFYRIKKNDDGSKELMFDVGAVCGNQVYIEYIGMGFSPCEETFLNPFEAEAVRKALNHHWEKTRKDGGKTEAAILRTGQELYYAECIVRASRNDLDPETLLATTRRNYRLTNKT